MENWKPVVGYEGFYEVSDLGRIRSVAKTVRSSCRNGGKRFRPAKMLRLKQRSNGYLSCSLSKDGVIRDALVHRLVARAFIPQMSETDVFVNHKNLNKTDNRVDNLEWCTPAYNNHHARENGVMPPSPMRKRIVCVDTGVVFPSSYQAAEWVNANQKQFAGQVAQMARRIRGCASGITKHAYGYRWRDVNDEPSTTIPYGSTGKRLEMGGPS